MTGRRDVLHEWGLRGWERDAVHVVVRRGVRPTAMSAAVGAIVVHESRRNSEDDIVFRNGLPMHSPERAAIDAAAWSTSSRAACGLLAAVVQQGLTTVTRLSAELETVGRVNRVRVMWSALSDIEGGSHALSEDLLRAAELMVSGGTEGPLIRLPAVACRTEPERVARILRALLAPAVRTSTLAKGTGF